MFVLCARCRALSAVVEVLCAVRSLCVAVGVCLCCLCGQPLVQFGVSLWRAGSCCGCCLPFGRGGGSTMVKKKFLYPPPPIGGTITLTMKHRKYWAKKNCLGYIGTAAVLVLQLCGATPPPPGEGGCVTSTPPPPQVPGSSTVVRARGDPDAPPGGSGPAASE